MFRIILALVTLTLPVAAHDTGQWENQPIYLRQWFQKLMQPDNPDMSCYGEADALEADSFEIRGDQYVAIITNGKGIIPEYAGGHGQLAGNGTVRARTVKMGHQLARSNRRRSKPVRNRLT